MLKNSYTRLVKVSLLFMLLILSACSQQAEEQPVRLQGEIFGSFWLATLPDEWSQEQVKQLQKGIQGELQKVDLAMSTYKEDSELNQLNAAPLEEWFALSPELYEVLSLSQEIASKTQGAFDVTLGEVVNLWSFGPEARPESIPEQKLIDERLATSGYQYLKLDNQAQAALKQKDSFIDLSGVAKGYAVDKVGQWLQEQGVNNFLVNVGGEIIVAGERAEGKPWRIGIEVPDGEQQSVHHIVPLTNNSVATSGDYRNYYEVEGQRMSHTINPKTGWPVNHQLTSVTVIHPVNAAADAWATAFMAMGTEASLNLANQEDVQVILISKEKDAWKTQMSASLQQSLGTELTNKILR